MTELIRWSDQFNCQNFSSEQERLCTSDMMILLLKYEAPDQIPHPRFKSNHSFLCKSFLKCSVSDLSYNTTSFALLVITLRHSEATVLARGTHWVSAALRNGSGMLHLIAWKLNKEISQKDTVVLTLPCGWQLKLRGERAASTIYKKETTC